MSEGQIINQAMQSLNVQHSDEENVVSLFHDFNAGHDLSNIYLLGKEIDLGLDDAFEITYDKSGNFVNAKPLKIARLLDGLKNCNTNYHIKYFCHDYISEILKALERCGQRTFNNFYISDAKHNEAHAKAINAFIAEVRKILRSEKIQQRIRNKSKNAYKNFKSAQAYVNALFDIHSRLCVVRVDLEYKRLPDNSMVSLEEARHDIRAVQTCVKKHPLFENCVGYLGKQEFGHDKGYHYHMLFFFNGSKEIEDVYLGDKIGDLWCQQITSGQGIYHNCNRKKYKDYGEKCGIGMVHHADLKLRENLDYAIGYAVKADQYVLAKPTARSRVFIRGQLPKIKKNTLGRPRRNIGNTFAAA